MKTFIYFLLIGISYAFSNTPEPIVSIDIVKITKSQGNLSESILENYLHQEVLDLSCEIEKEKALFQQNLNLMKLYDENYSTKKQKKVFKKEQLIWSEFKKITDEPLTDKNIEKIIKLSADLLIVNEEFLILSEDINF